MHPRFVTVVLLGITALAAGITNAMSTPDMSAIRSKSLTKRYDSGDESSDDGDGWASHQAEIDRNRAVNQLSPWEKCRFCSTDMFFVARLAMMVLSLRASVAFRAGFFVSALHAAMRRDRHMLVTLRRVARSGNLKRAEEEWGNGDAIRRSRNFNLYLENDYQDPQPHVVSPAYYTSPTAGGRPRGLSQVDTSAGHMVQHSFRSLSLDGNKGYRRTNY
ncbi:hypothetical protein SeMB42_g05366 [Synchytrium endobioticum]|uniref:Uncharacterized protein n=1 Tax=Synchytrium endobioticum TaxID=286115 RepID=A0A507D660_9FUNG|nr:hypothetical protein SeMB42_g05366 [Synchytrium endobioticum]TPX46916.1 hypothetical protein SeLEV6574_g02944 [Synchytrium endobioticum]